MKKKQTKKKKNFLIKIFVVLFILGFLVYLPELNGSFLLDDEGVILAGNKMVNYSTYLKERKHISRNRDSLAFWALMLSEIHFFGENPLGYKIVNLLFHIIASFVFFLFVRKILVLKYVNLKKEFLDTFSFLVALFFLVNPVNTEAVSYISGMNNGIGGFFFILGAWLYLFFYEKPTAIKWIFLFASFLSFVVAFFFKEVYIVFPVFYVIVYLFLNGFSRKKLVFALAGVVVFIAFLLFGAFRFSFSPFPIIKHALFVVIKKIGIQAIATNLFANLYALFLNIFPIPLNIDHDLPLINTLFDFRVIVSLLVILSLLVLLFKFREKMPLSLCCMLSYFLLMAPSNSLVLRGMEWTGYDILSERNLYAPSFFFSVVLFEFFWVVSGKNLKKFKSIATIIIVLFGIRTFVRNFDYKDSFTIWKASLKYSSNRPRPNFNYAVELKNKGLYNEAIPFAEKSFKLNPAPNSLGLLASLYKKTGRVEEYEVLLESALARKKFRNAILYHELGEFYYEKGDFKKAEKYFLKAIKKDRLYILPRLSLVFLYLNQSELQKTKAHLDFLVNLIEKNGGSVVKGVLIDNNVKSRVYFAKALYLFAVGENKSAIDYCKESIKLNPNFTEPYLKLGEYYYVNKKDDLALKYFKLARKTPDYEKYRPDVERMIENIKAGKKP